MSSRLIISAIAPNQSGMANKIAQLIHELGATIIESHMAVMAKEFALIMEITGEWNVLAKIEHQLPAKAQQMGLLTTIKRSEAPPLIKRAPFKTFRVSIVAVEDRGIIARLTQFFAESKVNIEELNCRTFKNQPKESRKGELKFTITLSEQSDESELRLSFDQLCHEFNLEATFDSI